MFWFTNDIPKTVEELDLMTKDAHLQSTLRDQTLENSTAIRFGLKKR